MKKLYIVIICLTTALLLFSGCDYFKEHKFGEIKIGENFIHSRDGHYKKLPNSFCLNVDLGSETSLIKVGKEHYYEDWDCTWYYDSPIIKGHYIKCFYNDKYLVLCEEYENDEFAYLTFEFASEQIVYYDTLEEIYELLNIDSIKWSSLCNTNEEIRAKE